jgi:hypothetical protein
MNPEDFVRTMIGAFGPYLPVMRQSVIAELTGENPNVIEQLSVYLIRHHPSQYGKPPGVSELLAALDELKALDQAQAMERKANAIIERKKQFLLGSPDEEVITLADGTKTTKGAEAAKAWFASLQARFEQREGHGVRSVGQVLGGGN